jgi:hypothetical protein
MIRHHLAGAAVGLALVFAAPALAQAPAATPAPAPTSAVTPAHLEAARDVVITSGISQSFESIYGEFRERVRQIVGTTRPEIQKDLNEVLDSLKPEADKKRDEITTVAAEIFARKMTEADLKEVAAFFKSPVGQRYNAFRPQAIDEIFTALQPWSLQTSNFLFDRFSQEMRKRGHQL